MNSKKTVLQRKKNALMRKLRAQGYTETKCPAWLATFSNKILPPVFFMFLAVLALHFLPVATTTPLKVNLGVVSVVSSSLSIYLALLMV
jgi:hypothetical protein